MKAKSVRVAVGAIASLLVILIVSGCSEPSATPVSQRAPGQDISKQARADKKGDVNMAPKGK
jgi:hypothetical protein